MGDDLDGMSQAVAADQDPVALEPIDATGSGGGWEVPVEPTTFSTAGATANCPNGCSLPADSLYLTGGDGTYGAPQAISSACATGATCTQPSGTEPTVPQVLPAGQLTTIYSAGVGSGQGAIDLSTGWWLAIPSSALSGQYSATPRMARTTV